MPGRAPEGRVVGMDTSPAPAGPREHRGPGADVARAAFLIVGELLALATVFFLWVLSGLSFGPSTDEGHPVWGYLVAAGCLAVLMTWASLGASHRGEGVTAVTQALMAMGTVVVILGGASYQHREDTPPPPDPCLKSPSAPWCYG
ncbi:hypothetical protein Sxan_22120 [Streptomyces xanthophaeus]|uniref:DUF6234 domain-containing protein n=2 Tax=Streptomyces xanthophaeus TaxID=67385 RepID=A0A919H192_9ACTN|nr:hypothetical protein Sxan_22120 [Streptomyces xanthophaeus]